VIDTLMNLLLRCRHRRLTSPLTRLSINGVPRGNPLVVCLDCGKQFEYDLSEMRIGKAIDHSHDVGVVPPRPSMPPTTKVKYAVLATVPVAMVIGAMLKTKKVSSEKNAPPMGEQRTGNPVAPAKRPEKK
jgi:hypothetical protein